MREVTRVEDSNRDGLESKNADRQNVMHILKHYYNDPKYLKAQNQKVPVFVKITSISENPKNKSYVKYSIIIPKQIRKEVNTGQLPDVRRLRLYYEHFLKKMYIVRTYVYPWSTISAQHLTKDI